MARRISRQPIPLGEPAATVATAPQVAAPSVVQRATGVVEPGPPSED